MGCLVLSHGSSLCDDLVTPGVSAPRASEVPDGALVWPDFLWLESWCGVPHWVADTGVLSNRSTLHFVHYCRWWFLCLKPELNFASADFTILAVHCCRYLLVEPPKRPNLSCENLFIFEPFVSGSPCCSAPHAQTQDAWWTWLQWQSVMSWSLGI